MRVEKKKSAYNRVRPFLFVFTFHIFYIRSENSPVGLVTIKSLDN